MSSRDDSFPDVCMVWHIGVPRLGPREYLDRVCFSSEQPESTVVQPVQALSCEQRPRKGIGGEPTAE